MQAATPENPLGRVVAVGPSLAQGREARKAEFLGHLLIVSVENTHVTREELEEAISEADVDERHVPRRISPRDAFRKAARKAEEITRRVPLGDPSLFGGPLGGPHANVLLREVKAADEEIVRGVVREVVDSSNVRLSYTTVARVELAPTDRGSDKPPGVRVTRLGAPASDPGGTELLPAEEGAIKQLVERYHYYREHYDSDAVRRVLLSVLHEGNPTPMRGNGGLYFVPRTHEEITRGLVRLADEIEERAAKRRDSRGRLSVVPIPLVDEARYRDVVEDSLEERVERQTRALVKEVGEVLRKNKRVSDKRRNSYLDRVRALQSDVAEYEELLRTEIAGARSGLEAAMRAATRLLVGTPGGSP
jgi:tetrahydromethanopterin S-methyltransferase subunit G